mmetsp:Transcript_8791/g.18242  ORF Transcript_8791/g.18242 Transcript_8791/m.18242 type:complete len:93 (-) Transcript_8791:208-486(-)
MNFSVNWGYSQHTHHRVCHLAAQAPDFQFTTSILATAGQCEPADIKMLFEFDACLDPFCCNGAMQSIHIELKLQQALDWSLALPVGALADLV